MWPDSYHEQEVGISLDASVVYFHGAVHTFSEMVQKPMKIRSQDSRYTAEIKRTRVNSVAAKTT